jgi:creatinine amidohydrolase
LSTRLDSTAWPEVAATASECLLVIPLGSTEQHGPHLTFTTDTEVAVALADTLAARRDDVVVAPPLAYGSSGEHAGFAGTLSLGAPAFERAIVELVRSADAFAGVVLVSAHGGNAAPLAAAVATLDGEGRNVLAWSPSLAGADAHAGRTETSMMLALRPEVVALEHAEPGDCRPIEDLLPDLRVGGMAAVSANGVLGDPSGASSVEGTALLHALADDLSAAVARWSA